MPYTHLISARQLQTAVRSPSPPLIFDCSFDLTKPSAGKELYLGTHISGAVYADLETALSAPPEEARCSGGRHPLPTRERFAAWLEGIGFSNGLQAVVYDRNNANFCGRLWWMLKWAGHDNVAILDGGLAAWRREGGLESSGEEPARPSGRFSLHRPLRELADATDVERAIADGSTSILDARARPRYLGVVEPLAPFAGHIPGAKNRPFIENFREDGTFKESSQLRQEFLEALEDKDPKVIHQCGSGVSAIPNLVAMELAGFKFGKLYAGSWSDWCSNPSRPRVRQA